MQWTGTLQEFRYGSMGISVLAGGCLFDREKRGFTTRTRSGQATLCLESPADPSPMAVDHLVSVEIHVGQCSIKASIHSQDFSPRHRHWSTGLQDWHHPCSFQSWIPRSFDPVSLQGSREQWYQSDISRNQAMARLLVFFYTLLIVAANVALMHLNVQYLGVLCVCFLLRLHQFTTKILCDCRNLIKVINYNMTISILQLATVVPLQNVVQVGMDAHHVYIHVYTYVHLYVHQM